MEWDGAGNARDLGGIPLAGGGTVAPGRVFRLTGPYMDSPKFHRGNLRRWPEKIAAVARAVAGADDGGVVKELLRALEGFDAEQYLLSAGLSPAGIARLRRRPR